MWWDSLGRPRQIWTCIKVIWENQKMSSGVIRLGQFRFRVFLTGDSEDKRRVWKNREKKLPFSKRAKTNAYLEDPGMIRLHLDVSFQWSPGAIQLIICQVGVSATLAGQTLRTLCQHHGMLGNQQWPARNPKLRGGFRSLGISLVTKWWTFRPTHRQPDCDALRFPAESVIWGDFTSSSQIIQVWLCHLCHEHLI